MMNWLDLFPQFRWPTLSNFVQPIAPVTSWFSPTIDIDYKGDAPTERDVVGSVAGYGSQLGTLLDAVAEIAEGHRGPCVERLLALKRDVDAVKRRHRADAAARAREALAALARSDPDMLRRVLAEFAGPVG